MSRLRARLATGRGGEAGLTLIELLVAATMAVILVGGAGMMVVSAVRTQPKISERAQNVSKARWVLERMTREIRNGVAVYEASGSQVSFLASVRRTACGAGVPESDTQPAIQCRITYTCTAGACTRAESNLDGEGASEATIVSGLTDAEVFSFSPDSEDPTYIGVTLNIPNPEGKGSLTVSDGATLRTLSLNS